MNESECSRDVIKFIMEFYICQVFSWFRGRKEREDSCINSFLKLHDRKPMCEAIPRIGEASVSPDKSG